MTGKPLRDVVHAALGGKCTRCGFSNPAALQIDHVRGNGNAQNRHFGYTARLRRTLDSVLSGEGKYQLLCANCNWIKRAENGETSARVARERLAARIAIVYPEYGLPS